MALERKSGLESSGFAAKLDDGLSNRCEAMDSPARRHVADSITDGKGAWISPMAVDRCVCWELTFADLRRIAESNSLDFDGLVNRTGCCTGCTTCEPYVRRMLRTGETNMQVMNAAEVRQELSES